MSRLSQLAVSKRSVTLLLAVALFIAGISAWGWLQQELLPDIDFPVITVVAPFPGAGATDVASQVAEPIERAIKGVPRLEKLQSTSANSMALARRPVRVRHRRQGDPGDDRAEHRERRASRLRSSPTSTALNINASPVVIASIAATDPTASKRSRRSPGPRSCPRSSSIEGVASADITGSLEPQVSVTLDPDKLAEPASRSSRSSGCSRPTT